MQVRTILTAEVPRVECEEHGVKQMAVPWAEPGSRCTAMFEMLVINWLREANISAVARRLGLTWDQTYGVMQRAVVRGLARRESKPLRAIGIDETAYQKRHDHVTIIDDIDRQCVLEVDDSRSQQVLEDFYWNTPF